MVSSENAAAEGGAVPLAEKKLKSPFPNLDLAGNHLPPSPAPSTPRTGRRYALATELVFTEGNDQFRASSVPIYQVREAVPPKENMIAC
jgi:cystathionine beta-lyase